MAEIQLFEYLEFEGAKNFTEKITFNIVQIKFLAMHITKHFFFFFYKISSWNMIFT